MDDQHGGPVRHAQPLDLPPYLAGAGWQAGITLGLVGRLTDQCHANAGVNMACSSQCPAYERTRALAAGRGPGKAALPVCRAWSSRNPVPVRGLRERINLDPIRVAPASQGPSLGETLTGPFAGTGRGQCTPNAMASSRDARAWQYA
jgi:hypothetical protein